MNQSVDFVDGHVPRRRASRVRVQALMLNVRLAVGQIASVETAVQRALETTATSEHDAAAATSPLHDALKTRHSASPPGTPIVSPGMLRKPDRGRIDYYIHRIQQTIKQRKRLTATDMRSNRDAPYAIGRTDAKGKPVRKASTPTKRPHGGSVDALVGKLLKPDRRRSAEDDGEEEDGEDDASVSDGSTAVSPKR